MKFVLNKQNHKKALIRYDKPAKSYQQLVYGLSEKGLILEPPEAQIIQLLKRNNYYSIVNGHKEVFLDKTKDKETFLPGTTFNDLFYLYKLDQELMNTLFEHILEIEVSLKSKLSYVIANNIGIKEPKILWRKNSYIRFDFSGSYLDKKHYHKDTSMSLLSSIASAIHKTSNDPTKYYRENKNHIPPWIAFENLYLYQIKDLSKYLSSNNKKNLGDLFTYIYKPEQHSISYGLIISMLGIIHDFRNKIAHGQRFYSYVSDLSYISDTDLKTITDYEIVKPFEYRKGIGKNDFFALLISLVVLIDDPYKAQLIAARLPGLLNKYDNEEYFLKATHIPDDYRQRLTRLIQSIY